MVVAVNEVSVDASLLQSSHNSLLHLLFLGLLNSHLVLLVENLLRNTLCIESHWLHCSNLHCHLVTCVSSWFVGLYHSAKGVLAHVVVNLNVLTLEYEVSVEFHLLASNS